MSQIVPTRMWLRIGAEMIRESGLVERGLVFNQAMQNECMLNERLPFYLSGNQVDPIRIEDPQTI